METQAQQIKEFLLTPNLNTPSEGIILFPYTDIMVPPKSLSLIAGRPGMEKTAYLFDIVKANSMNGKKDQKRCLGYFPRINSERLKKLNDAKLYINDMYTHDIIKLERSLNSDIKRIIKAYLETKLP